MLLVVAVGACSVRVKVHGLELMGPVLAIVGARLKALGLCVNLETREKYASNSF